MYDFKTHAKHTRVFVLLQKRTESDIDCLDEKELVSEIVGMTNTEGGVLYLGVEDNGDITGVHKKHRDPNGAMALIANKTVPSLSVRAEIIEE